VSASAHHVDTIRDPGPLRAPKLRAVAWGLLAIGAITFAVLILGNEKSKERAWSSFLQGMLIPTFIGIAAVFYIAVHSVTNARWLLPLRRLMEGLSSGLLITLVAFLSLAFFGAEYLYDWINLSGTKHQNLFHVHGTKSELMTFNRWFLTNVVIILAWLWFRYRLVKFSVDQDTTGADIRGRHRRIAIGFLPVFAIGITLFVWDLLLSLHVNWFSTMWGVYCFTSAVQTFLCVTILFMVWLRRGPMREVIQEHTVHDIGTWMVGWSCFCAYIGFSQYMLIWYANLDEETFFYVIRNQHGYGLAYAIEALIRWPLVFLGLMSQSVRTKPWALVTISIAALIGNWMDWSWIIMPAFSPNEYRGPWSLPEVLIGAGFVGAFLLVALRFWAKYGLIAKGEPRLLATVNAEHLH